MELDGQDRILRDRSVVADDQLDLAVVIQQDNVFADILPLYGTSFQFEIQTGNLQRNCMACLDICILLKPQLSPFSA